MIARNYKGRVIIRSAFSFFKPQNARDSQSVVEATFRAAHVSKRAKIHARPFTSLLLNYLRPKACPPTQQTTTNKKNGRALQVSISCCTAVGFGYNKENEESTNTFAGSKARGTVITRLQTVINLMRNSKWLGKKSYFLRSINCCSP